MTTKKNKKPGPAKTEPLKQTSKDFRLVSRDTEKMPVELSQEERDRCAIHLAELVEEKEDLTAEKRDVVREWRVKLNAKQEEIDDCAAGVLKGAKPTAFTIETRAVFKTRMIERVRAEDGRVVEKRPMTPEEEVKYLQTDIGEAARSQPAALLREPAPAVVEPTEESEGDELGEDERAALGGLPKGWPKKWVDGQWKVDGDERPLTGGDIREVHLRVSAKGSTTAQVHQAVESFLSLGATQRALSLLLRRKLIVTSEGGVWFVAEDAPAVPTEPGKNDPLPEASAAPKPKRRGPKTKAEAMLNAGLEQSAGMEATH